MPFKLRRPRHATVVAYLALFVALGGSSYAAVTLSKNSVRSKHIKNGQVKAKDIRKNAVRSSDVKDGALRAKDFAAGELPAGPVGAPGPAGPAGPPGADGAGGSALLTGTSDGLPTVGFGGSSTRRTAVNGYAVASSNPPERSSLSPARELRARNLSARILDDIPDGGSVTVSFVVNEDGLGDLFGLPTLSCTITGTAGADDRTCTAAGPPLTVPANSVIFMRIEILGGAVESTAPGRAYWGLSLEPT